MSLRRIGFLTVAVVVAFVAAALVVPLEAFRAPLEAAASRALARDVRIAGALHFELFPQLGISAKQVSIANPAGGGPNLLEIGKLVVGAELWPLLGGHLQVHRIVLKQPVIHLAVDAKGVGNWETLVGTAGAGGPSGVSLAFDRVKIEDATLIYTDVGLGKTATLSAVSMDLTTGPETGNSGASGARSLSLDGEATYNAVPAKFAGDIADLDAFLAGKPTKATLSLTAAPVAAAFDGTLQTPGALAGNLKLDAPSLRGLAAWAGEPLPPGNGFGVVSIQAAVNAKNGVLALSGATIALDGMKLAGDLSLDTTRPIPSVKGTLTVDRIDARPYLVPAKDAAKPAGKPAPDEPLALGGLKGVEADLALTVGPVIVPNVTLDRAVMAVALHGGVLTVAFSQVAAYGGTGKATLTVDASGPIPAIRDVLDMTGIRAERFMGEMMGVARVNSSGAVHLDIASRGSSEAEFVRALSGKSTINFGPGTISGVDLGLVAKLLQSTAGLLKGAVGDAARTEFTAMSASFAIENGVARTSDFRMTAPTVSITGAGSVDLMTQRLDFHLDPKAELGIAINIIGIGVPFHVGGTIEDPSFTADPLGAATELVKSGAELPGKVLGVPGKVLSVPGDALKSIFGSGK